MGVAGEKPILAQSGVEPEPTAWEAKYMVLSFVLANKNTLIMGLC